MVKRYEKEYEMSHKVRERSEIPMADTWDVESIFPTVEAWEEAVSRAPQQLERLARFRGWSQGYMASMLASIGSEAAPALRDSLADEEEEPWVRAVAADALLMLKDFEAGDLAARVVELEDDPELLTSALRLLTEVGRPEHIPVIRVRCASPDPRVRSHALSALGTLGEEEDVPRLLGAMSDPSPWVAIHAARGVISAGAGELLRDLAYSDHPRAELAQQV
ncbi:MAG: HEAT repeat domain-containing protein, partial [Candidatus Promineifilaceae bacterium]|nr:HEAT repeat domain-containing protein [Candidatus Promineifilaceae bacterium]